MKFWHQICVKTRSRTHSNWFWSSGPKFKIWIKSELNLAQNQIQAQTQIRPKIQRPSSLTGGAHLSVTQSQKPSSQQKVRILKQKVRLLKPSTNLEANPTIPASCRLNFTCGPCAEHRTDMWGHWVYSLREPSLSKPKTSTDSFKLCLNSVHKPTGWHVGPTSTTSSYLHPDASFWSIEERENYCCRPGKKRKERGRWWRRLRHCRLFSDFDSDLVSVSSSEALSI